MSTFPAFTPLTSLLGGLILSVSTSTLLAGYGHVLGVSGKHLCLLSTSHSCTTNGFFSPSGIAHSVSSDPICSTLASSDSKKAAKRAGVPAFKVACFAGFLAGGRLLRVYQAPLNALVGSPVFDLPYTTSLASRIGRTLLAGLLTGLGTKLGSGCTSGHMLVGLARLSWRSFIATCTFFSVAFLTAQFLPASLPPSPPITTPQFSLPTILLLQLPFLVYSLAPSVLPSKLAKPIATFFIGMHFAFGLALAGMTRPTKVLSFFYLPFEPLPQSSRTWDPSLAMVAIGGLLPNMAIWSAVKQWSKPLWSDTWSLPTRKDVDWKLVVGAALFGVGWGMSGLCPGPALTVLGSGNTDLWPFVGTFVLGGVLGNFV